jgi:hypothetical protein
MNNMYTQMLFIDYNVCVCNYFTSFTTSADPTLRYQPVEVLAPHPANWILWDTSVSISLTRFHQTVMAYCLQISHRWFQIITIYSFIQCYITCAVNRSQLKKTINELLF